MKGGVFVPIENSKYKYNREPSPILSKELFVSKRDKYKTVIKSMEKNFITTKYDDIIPEEKLIEHKKPV